MFDFSTPVDRHNTWCTQWDYVADRFGHADLLPFTISDMDFATAPCVLAALHQRLAHGVLGYSRWQHDDFLGALQGWFQSRFDTVIDTKSAVYGPSVIYMVSALIQLWSAPGDAVVIHTPAYDAFYKVIEGNQRQVLACPLTRDNVTWRCDMAALERLLARPECKILLLCSPHNPTGKVWQEEELRIMAGLCARHGVRVISDEIHMDMVWQGRHRPWAAIAPPESDWALLTSASKSFNIPALTGAYGLISDDVTRGHYLQQLKGRDGLSSPAVLALTAHIAAYQKGAPWLDALRNYLAENLRWTAEALNHAFPTLGWQPPEATYLAWIDLRPLAMDDEALQRQLMEHERVAIMPGTTYGAEGRGFVRLNAGCPRSKLEHGVNALIHALRTLQAQ